MDTIVSVHVVIPVKAFDAGKTRLNSILDVETRSQLSREMVARTVALALDRVDLVTVVTSDATVAEAARTLGAKIHPDPGTGLSDAVLSGVDTVTGPWLVFHSDLPLLSSDDVSALVEVAERGVIVPSPDGGTPVIGATRHGFPFSYGPGSFHRHLRALPAARILTRLGASLDIDSPADLVAAMTHPRGVWLRDLVGTPVTCNG